MYVTTLLRSVGSAALMCLAMTAQAQNTRQVDLSKQDSISPGETKNITVFGQCYTISNSSQAKFFIPFGSQTEWKDDSKHRGFANNPPAGVKITACTPVAVSPVATVAPPPPPPTLPVQIEACVTINGALTCDPQPPGGTSSKSGGACSYAVLNNGITTNNGFDGPVEIGWDSYPSSNTHMTANFVKIGGADYTELGVSYGASGSGCSNNGTCASFGGNSCTLKPGRMVNPAPAPVAADLEACIMSSQTGKVTCTKVAPTWLSAGNQSTPVIATTPSMSISSTAVLVGSCVGGVWNGTTGIAVNNTVPFSSYGTSSSTLGKQTTVIGGVTYVIETQIQVINGGAGTAVGGGTYNNSVYQVRCLVHK